MSNPVTYNIALQTVVTTDDEQKVETLKAALRKDCREAGAGASITWTAKPAGATVPTLDPGPME